MRLWPRTLSLRLALMFALVGVLLLGALGFFLYQSLQREIAWRDDQALLGRLQRMQALLDDAASIEALRRRPQLYENMLGNRDNLLWIVDAQGRPLIEVNPPALPLPHLPPASAPRLADAPGAATLRLAWLDVPRPGGARAASPAVAVSRSSRKAAPSSSRTGPAAKVPRRNLGPCKSIRMPTGRLNSRSMRRMNSWLRR